MANCAARAVDPMQYREFAVNLSRLFSGTTVYQYVSGALQGDSRAALTTIDAAARIVFCWMAVGLVCRRNRKRAGATERMMGCLTAGFAAALGTFFLIAGPDSLSPGFERYGIWMIGPAAILVASGWEWWLTRPGRARRLAGVAAVMLGWGLLLGFQTNYSTPLSFSNRAAADRIGHFAPRPSNRSKQRSITSWLTVIRAMTFRSSPASGGIIGRCVI